MGKQQGLYEWDVIAGSLYVCLADGTSVYIPLDGTLATHIAIQEMYKKRQGLAARRVQITTLPNGYSVNIVGTGEWVGTFATEEGALFFADEYHKREGLTEDEIGDWMLPNV